MNNLIPNVFLSPERVFERKKDKAMERAQREMIRQCSHSDDCEVSHNWVSNMIGDDFREDFLRFLFISNRFAVLLKDVSGNVIELRHGLKKTIFEDIYLLANDFPAIFERICDRSNETSEVLNISSVNLGKCDLVFRDCRAYHGRLEYRDKCVENLSHILTRLINNYPNFEDEDMGKCIYWLDQMQSFAVSYEGGSRRKSDYCDNLYSSLICIERIITEIKSKKCSTSEWGYREVFFVHTFEKYDISIHSEEAYHSYVELQLGLILNYITSHYSNSEDLKNQQSHINEWVYLYQPELFTVTEYGARGFEEKYQKLHGDKSIYKDVLDTLVGLEINHSYVRAFISDYNNLSMFEKMRFSKSFHGFNRFDLKMLETIFNQVDAWLKHGLTELGSKSYLSIFDGDFISAQYMFRFFKNNDNITESSISGAFHLNYEVPIWVEDHVEYRSKVFELLHFHFLEQDFYRETAHFQSDIGKLQSGHAFRYTIKTIGKLYDDIYLMYHQMKDR